ncbi:peptidylprolyl isomerase [Candidatus Falkowbacteria bacterium]|nr:peptidylprolyl isomerase [Candidatus Falkowbacteria bacterium]
MKKTFLLLFVIFFLSACSGPLAKKDIVNNEIRPMDQNKDKDMQEEKKFEKRFLEQLEHTDLAAEYEYAVIKTNMGDIKVEFFDDKSPITVNNFMNLANKGFYDGTTFHRVVKDFMIQGGDPNSKDDNPENDGQGGPGYRFADEFNKEPLVKGSLAMANSGPNTNGSQFFIVTAESTPWLDGKHTNFGRVVEGMDVVEAIEDVDTDRKIDPTNKRLNDRPFENVVIESIELIKR